MTDFAATMTDHYLIAALWASYGEDGEPLDANYGTADFTDDTVVQAARQCAAFLAECGRQRLDMSLLTAEQCGHDFWLTRNGHGAGFWDRDLGALGDVLTEIAHGFGEAHVFETDQGTLEIDQL